MKVTIEIDLEECDYPRYCDRVNHAMRQLLTDHNFLTGAYKSGHFWHFLYEESPIMVKSSYQSFEERTGAQKGQWPHEKDFVAP